MDARRRGLTHPRLIGFLASGGHQGEGLLVYLLLSAKSVHYHFFVLPFGSKAASINARRFFLIRSSSFRPSSPQ